MDSPEYLNKNIFSPVLYWVMMRIIVWHHNRELNKILVYLYCHNNYWHIWITLSPNHLGASLARLSTLTHFAVAPSFPAAPERPVLGLSCLGAAYCRHEPPATCRRLHQGVLSPASATLPLPPPTCCMSRGNRRQRESMGGKEGEKRNGGREGR